MPEITFHPATAADLPLLREWTETPHWREWWGDPDEELGFIRDMVAGRGFIALAALILGKWRPWPTFLTCLLFGLLDAAAIRLQGALIPGMGVPFPVQAVQALPYALTVALLAGFVGRSIPPKASGLPYVKER